MIVEAQWNPSVIKYYDYVKERELKEHIPEMVPEFVIPDLSDFKVSEQCKNSVILVFHFYVFVF